MTYLRPPLRERLCFLIVDSNTTACGLTSSGLLGQTTTDLTRVSCVDCHGALVRRGLATFQDSEDEDREADVISIVKMPAEAAR